MADKGRSLGSLRWGGAAQAWEGRLLGSHPNGEDVGEMGAGAEVGWVGRPVGFAVSLFHSLLPPLQGRPQSHTAR